MNPVFVRNTSIGEGRPKICVPIVADTADAILQEAASFRELPLDLAEWRADHFRDVHDTDAVLSVGRKLREALGDIPLLFTFRTASEGGQTPCSKEAYTALNQAVVRCGFPDLIDVELFSGDENVRETVRLAHDAGIKVIVSNHDFHATPAKEELLSRLIHMQRLGADLPKIAVMPRSQEDVLTLLSATVEMKTHHSETPVITMSMSGTGMISRLSGECFGSALTFGAARKASAPGQLHVEELAKVLDIIHRNGSTM